LTIQKHVTARRHVASAVMAWSNQPQKTVALSLKQYIDESSRACFVWRTTTHPLFSKLDTNGAISFYQSWWMLCRNIEHPLSILSVLDAIHQVCLQES